MTKLKMKVMEMAIKFIEKSRFREIYLMSVGRPSWEVIGSMVLGERITQEEFEFVISKTRRKYGK